MEYTFKLNLFGKILTNLIKKDVPSKDVLKKIRTEYKNILVRAKDIGNKNNLLFSYTLAAFFIAMNRNDKFFAEDNYLILEEALEESRLVKLMMGNAKSYFKKSKMEQRRKWCKQSHNHKYENDWVNNFIPKDDKYEFGIDYIECGVCKLCKDENCLDLAPYLCRLDFMLADLIGVKLHRTMTIANGDPKCDFRYERKDK